MRTRLVRIVGVLAAASLAACGTSGGGPVPVGQQVPVLGWAVQAGGTGLAIGLGMSVFADRSVAFVGAYSGEVTVAPGTLQATTLPEGGGSSTFVARYDFAGTLLWARSAFGSSYVSPSACAALDDGSLAVVGFFEGTATFGAGTLAVTVLDSAGSDDAFLAVYGPGGALTRAIRIGGAAGFDQALAVAAFPGGALAVTGLFEGDVTFGAGEFRETTLSTPGLAAFVARYAQNGSLSWAQAVDAPDGYATGWTVAAIGFDVVVAGEFQGSAVFGAGQPSETTIPSLGSDDLWIARFAAAGEFLWARSISGPDEDEVQRITADAGGDIRLTGFFRGQTTLGGEGPSPVTLVAVSPVDGFLAAYDGSGNLSWAARFGGPDDDAGYGVHLLDDGAAIVTGTIRGEATLSNADGSVGATLGDSGDLSRSFFVARWSAGGVVEWARIEGGPGGDLGMAVEVDAREAAIFVAGAFQGTVAFGDPGGPSLTAIGSQDAFLARFDVAPGLF